MTAKAYHSELRLSRADLRAQFVAQLHAIAGDVRFLFLPKLTDAASSIEESSLGAILTHDSTFQGRLSALGLGYAVSYSGGQYGTAPDLASYSFGTGAADASFSLFAVSKVTDTAAGRTLLAKNDSLNQEWAWTVDSNDKLSLQLTDQSVGVSPIRISDNAITQGSWVTLGSVFNIAGGTGATAANGITHYQNGVVLPSTATNAGTYVAMENLAAKLEVAAMFNTGSARYVGSHALLMLVSGALTAAQMWALRQACAAYLRV